MSNSVVIKKYANRRLYNTQTSTYVTLEDLYDMVKKGQDFEVVDAKTGKDITRKVLAQIIFEEETQGTSLMPIKFLRQLIHFYDDSLQCVLPHYLEMSMDVFSQNREDFQERANKVAQSFQPFSPPLSGFEDIQKQNMQFFETTLKMFNPFLFSSQNSKEEKIQKLSKQIEELNKQLDILKKES